MQCELISWSEVQRLCLQLAKQIKSSGFIPELVVAIGRGGYVPARLVCDYLDIMALTSIKIELYTSGSTKMEKAVIKYPLCNDIRDQRVLIVDDVNDSGDTLELAQAHLQTFQPRETKIAVIHNKISSHIPVDYYARKVIKWRWLIYPWAIHEDISGFLKDMPSSIKSIEKAQQYLIDKFNFRISKKQLRNIIGMENTWEP
ncbi:MAG: phosphoribosyltransferase [gamma proteobacterium symbiont of Lucinoma myriamae]|nr:phosphoribosyltransferase [gamma proteobacterium symbiont of Lucinoma myriamae]